MIGDRPRYELHFHSSVQSALMRDYNKITQIFQEKIALFPSEPLYQLPPNLADFIGRQKELERLRLEPVAAAPSGEVGSKICAITGVAGVGKSTLAIHVTHQLKSQFPDAQLYVNLRGAESQPLEPLEVLAGFLRIWGVNNSSMPEDLSERSALYRSLLSGKRVLVVLDNARDEAQIRPLLPDSSTCAVLVTTRRHIDALQGATVLNLTGMTEPEALELLQQLVGVDRIQAELEAAKNIINLCDRLPLAIRICGGTLRNKPQWQLEDYASKLAQERQRLIQLRLSDLDVRTALTPSYQELDVTTARLFRLLGLLPGANFAPSVAAILLESEPATAKESVEYLVNMQLLEPASVGRYRFHDLVRLFARGQLAQEEPAEARQAARLRTGRWYLETSEMMDLALNPETCRQIARVLVENNNQSLRATEQDLLLGALNWFETERTNLLTCIEWAYQAQVWEIVTPLARNLVNFFNTYACWSDWERTHLLALEATRKLGDRYREAQTLINLGNVHSLQSNWGKASECYKQSLSLFSELEDPLGMAKTLGNLGNVYSRQDYWGKASESYQQSLDIFRELKDNYGEAQTLTNMGILYIQQSDKENAVVLWQEALSKLPPDLPKSKRVVQWLQSIKGANTDASDQAGVVQRYSERNLPAERKSALVLGGFMIVLAIALFLLFLVH
jgi:tetratricopeptide (TPR) repeat protein